MGVQPEHEDLFARYVEIVERIDGMKGEQKRLARESAALQHAIRGKEEEAARVQRQQEEAKSSIPSQIAVSDVLISVDIEGSSAPLQLRPWDTNFDKVVSEWLAVEHQAAELKNSLVLYLRHLEDTAETFPVRAEGKLEEIRDQFAT